MKTTLDIPDALFRKAEAAAAERGISLHAFVSDALAEKVVTYSADGKPCMKSFGALRSLRKETARINRLIEKEFETIEPDDRVRSSVTSADGDRPNAE